jgi:glycine dehydrogenase subunit 1
MRYLPHTAEDIQAMLGAIGVGSIDELFAQIPEDLRPKRALDLPAPMSELQLERHLRELADRNKLAQRSFLGAGLYEHHAPAALQQILLRAEFYTSYTPYQPEISQGTTKAIFEFQSMMTTLLGMDVANASMYDGAHATAEAALMAQRVTRRDHVYVVGNVHPEYRAVTKTYLLSQPGTYHEVDFDEATGRVDLDTLKAAVVDPAVTACIIVQTPNFFGVLEDLAPITAWAASHGILVACAFNEPMAFALVTPPGEQGVDLCIGEGASLGMGTCFGGPAVGVFSCREKHIRSMPGRLAGRTVDAKGREGYVLTLSTREQHIKREKATSNICTNQGLIALGISIYMSLLGKEGLREVAHLNMSRARYAEEALARVGVKRVHTGPYFNEFAVTTRQPAAEVIARAGDAGLLAGLDLGRIDTRRDHQLLIACTELTERAAIDELAALLA